MKYIYINNEKIKYTIKNKSIIEYCENIGINIPHFCYHKNLSIAGNCRMCLVELKNSPKPLISCAMSLLNKMEINTDSPLVKKSRENILEFLLLNHPLDCPICDQGGECDLQDQAFIFGSHKKRFFNFKRIVTNKNISVIIKTVMTRCIHCTRCIRFANEITGTSELGIFNRGVNSEIGTYIGNIFNSELSGNVIDICPVGALTIKQFPYSSRVWELKTVKSIDYSDGFALDLLISIKNNKITKITPKYNDNSWLSDKTRFSFDGMFSVGHTYQNNFDDLYDEGNGIFWKNVLEDITKFLYFQDHLTFHKFQHIKIFFIFDNNISIDILSLLLLLVKKYSFITLRIFEKNNKINNLESSFITTTTQNSKLLTQSNFCLLVGVNPRYEGYSFNLKLRQRYLKGNFKIVSVSSFINLTYYTKFLGANLKNFNLLIEGNHLICQELKFSKNPIFIYSSEMCRRKDINGFQNQLNEINKLIYNKKKNNVNLLNTSLNDSGLLSLNHFEHYTWEDMVTATGLYFVNIDLLNPYMTTLIYFSLYVNWYVGNHPYIFLINQNFWDLPYLKSLLKSQYSREYFYLPSKTFYENSNYYINTEGLYKYCNKILTTQKSSRENWTILRTLFFFFDKILFTSFIKLNNLIGSICFDTLNFNKILSYLYFPVRNLNESYTYLNNKTVCYFPLKASKFQLKKKKNLTTKVRLWLDDFFIKGNDVCSRHSIVMIQCSKNLRKKSTCFEYIL